MFSSKLKIETLVLKGHNAAKEVEQKMRDEVDIMFENMVNVVYGWWSLCKTMQGVVRFLGCFKRGFLEEGREISSFFAVL